VFNYYTDFRKFGIKDDLIFNGYSELCEAYAIKLKIQIRPLVAKIIQQERFNKPEVDENGLLSTNAPYDLFKILSESFDLVVGKEMKKLILKALEIYYQITVDYQIALNKLIDVRISIMIFKE
jgi:hypothetical protein